MTGYSSPASAAADAAARMGFAGRNGVLLTAVGPALQMGVDEATVRAELGKRNAGNPATVDLKSAETGGLEDVDAGNTAPEWFQGDADSAELAKKQARKNTKKIQVGQNDRPVLPKGHAQPKGNRVYKSPGRGRVAGAPRTGLCRTGTPPLGLMDSDGGVTFKCRYSMRKVKAHAPSSLPFSKRGLRF